MSQSGKDIVYDPLLVPVKLRVSVAAARHLRDIGIDTVEDALRYAPRRYYHWGKLTRLEDLTEGEDVTVLANVVSQTLIRNRSGNGVRLLVNITDGTATLQCTFFAKKEYSLSRHMRLLQKGESFLFAGKINVYQGTRQLVQPTFEEIESESPEAILRKSGRPIPIYRAKSSMPSWKISTIFAQIFSNLDWSNIPELLSDQTRQKNGLLTMGEAYKMLHFPQDDIDWQNAHRTLAWNEAYVLQTALLRPKFEAQVDGKNRSVPLLTPDDVSIIDGVLSSLPFELTNGQQEAWKEIREDIAKTVPMQRLLQADVGAGKTVIALLAMLRSVEAGYQAALLAPTEVLATQHLTSLQKLLGNSVEEVPLYLLTSNLSSATKREVLTHLAAGEPAIVIGTHALLQEQVELPTLGLLVVDEQHRFGVEQRELLREGREYIPHLLVMTATPIPRTIAMTVFGDLDITTMRELPVGRSPIDTFRVDESKTSWMSRLWQRAKEEIASGGRVYVVCPRIYEEEASDDVSLPSIEEMQVKLASEPALQDVGIVVMHGQQKPEENALAISKFASGEAGMLLATTVIEVGVDVPEATMMIVMGASQFGLSQLHQLRGRVGRSNRSSVCMLVHSSTLNPVAEARLQALVESSDGFSLAETDLRLRREGDVLGQQQSGGKSSLSFLSVRRDAEIIQAARDEVISLLHQDPSLTDNQALKDATKRRIGESLVWLERS